MIEMKLVCSSEDELKRCMTMLHEKMVGWEPYINNEVILSFGKSTPELDSNVGLLVINAADPDVIGCTANMELPEDIKDFTTVMNPPV